MRGDKVLEINQQVKLFDKQAKKYSKRKKKNASELRMRQKLLHSAQGEILELSVGAGANFQFYPKEAKVTAVDFSASMIEQAEDTAREQNLDAHFIVGNVEEVELPEKN